MRAFVTGGTGFVGRRLVALLRARGDVVVALVRSPARAEGLDAELVEGDLSSRERLSAAMAGADAVFHLAADYRIGIPPRERAAMHEANVRGTENVLDAARDAGVARTVYVSTVNAFGNTRGEIVDETYERPGGDFVSEYDRTKWLAHRAARERIDRSDPIVIVHPGVIYGPDDRSEIGGQLERAARGKLLFVSFGALGFNAVHVDDVAAGILLAHDRGRLAEAYVLGGEITTMRDAVRGSAAAAGKRPPRITMPTALMRPLVPVGPLVGRVTGTSPNLKELISASDGVTYWARDDKARRELGYDPRPLAAGLADTFGR
ncbi:MAG TPA: NAD-dependent epimerase/dehydratase family protein [Gaiellaceae bacterium]